MQHLPERRHPVPRLRRVVRAAEERLAVRREEDRHRPAAVAGERDDGVHVDRVDVRPLLAVDLDADEVLVHQRGGRLVLERLVLHDVAPVAGRVADREQDRLVLGAGARERLLAPRVPVHRVVGVLEEVGAGFLREAVHRDEIIADVSYETLEVGAVYRSRFGRTVLEADNVWFTLLTLNTNPIHFDAAHAATTEWGKPLVDSTFTLALVTGLSVVDVSERAVNLGWREVTLPAPVFAGDTIRAETEIAVEARVEVAAGSGDRHGADARPEPARRGRDRVRANRAGAACSD